MSKPFCIVIYRVPWSSLGPKNTSWQPWSSLGPKIISWQQWGLVAFVVPRNMWLEWPFFFASSLPMCIFATGAYRLFCFCIVFVHVHSRHRSISSVSCIFFATLPPLRCCPVAIFATARTAAPNGRSLLHRLCSCLRYRTSSSVSAIIFR